MKTLHVLYSGLGGASSVVFSLLKENKKKILKNNDILFTGNYLFKGYKDRAKKTNNNYFFIKTRKLLPWLYWFKIFLFLCKKKPDLIFLHNFQFVPVLLYKLIFWKKIIYIDHQSENFLKLKSTINIIISLFFFNFIVFVNKKKSLNFKKKFNFFKRKISHIPNSVDIDFFRNSIKDKNNKQFVIGMAARLDSGKRHELVIKTLNHPKLKHFNIIFLIVGRGANIDYLKALTKKEGLINKVIFNGSLSENKMKLWYKKLNLYAHATNGEGMSISILEAMSMKIPVIGSNVDGVKNLLNAKKNIGMLFENSILDLAKKIEFFYKSSEVTKTLFKEKQRKFIEDNYSSTIMFNNYKKIILKIISK